MFEQFLEEIGLSEKESKIYLALLQVDRDTIQDLANRTGVKRTTVYPVLETLQKKGLVSEVQEGKKVSYMAEPPERLETFVERQKVLWEEKTKRLKDVIPQIKSIQRESGERPVVKYFEGRDGAVAAYEEFYESINETDDENGYFIYNRDLVEQVFTEMEMQRFRDIRLGKNLKPITVYNYAAGEFDFKTPGIRTRIDHNKYPITCDVTIAKDKIVITTLGEHVSSFLLISQDIADTLKSLILKINEN